MVHDSEEHNCYSSDSNLSFNKEIIDDGNKVDSSNSNDESISNASEYISSHGPSSYESFSHGPRLLEDQVIDPNLIQTVTILPLDWEWNLKMQ